MTSCSFVSKCILVSFCFAMSPAVATAQQSARSTAAAPPIPNPLAPLPQLAPDKARIFFFRKPQFAAMAADARIALDGVTAGWVGGGSAVFVDHGPGNVAVTIGGEDSFLVSSSRMTFAMTLEPGKEYFVGLVARGLGRRWRRGAVSVNRWHRRRAESKHPGRALWAGLVRRRVREKRSAADNGENVDFRTESECRLG